MSQLAQAVHGVLRTGSALGFLNMDLATLGILLAVAGIVMTIVLGLPPLLRRRSVTYWTSPSWTRQTQKIGTRRVPTLAIRWSVRGSKSNIQGVLCATQGPSGEWFTFSHPKGVVNLPKEDLFTYINLLSEKPFNSTITSPSDIGKPVTDAAGKISLGRYKLRICWYEGNKKRQHEKIFSFIVKN